MRLQKMLFVIVLVLFALLGENTCIAGSNDMCQEFTLRSDGWCEVEYNFAWAAFGGGWTTVLSGAGNISPNINQGEIQFQFWLKNGKMATYKDNINGQKTGYTYSYVLQKGQSVEVTFLSDQNGSNQAVSCAMRTLYLASKPEYLRGLPKPSINFSSTGGLLALQQVLDPASRWRSPIAVDLSKNELYAFAIANFSSIPITVSGQLLNDQGVTVGNQIWTITPNGGNYGMYLHALKNEASPGFGGEIFSNGRFTGWLMLEITSPTDGKFVPFAIRQIGNSMTNTDISSF
jgi:hypothetical protein